MVHANGDGVGVATIGVHTRIGKRGQVLDGQGSIALQRRHGGQARHGLGIDDHGFCGVKGSLVDCQRRERHFFNTVGDRCNGL